MPRGVRVGALPDGVTRETLHSWSLNVWRFSYPELLQLNLAIFEASGVLSALPIDAAKFASFLQGVTSAYRPNPYHNVHHATQVVHVAWLLARSGVGTDRKPLAPIDLLSLLVAALGHDVDHPGTNNTFLVQSGSPLAIYYNDDAVLESHHASMTFRILRKPENDILSAFPRDERREVRAAVISAIKATDMAEHATHGKELTEVAAEVRGIGSIALAKALLHLADLSNAVQPFDASKRWAHCVVAEFRSQSAKERQLGLPLTDMFVHLHTDAEIAKLQLGFIDVIVAPLWRTAALLFPGAKARIEVLEMNRAAWQRELDASATPPDSPKLHATRAAAEEQAEAAEAASRAADMEEGEEAADAEEGGAASGEDASHMEAEAAAREGGAAAADGEVKEEEEEEKGQQGASGGGGAAPWTARLANAAARLAAAGTAGTAATATMAAAATATTSMRRRPRSRCQGSARATTVGARRRRPRPRRGRRRRTASCAGARATRPARRTMRWRALRRRRPRHTGASSLRRRPQSRPRRRPPPPPPPRGCVLGRRRPGAARTRGGRRHFGRGAA